MKRFVIPFVGGVVVAVLNSVGISRLWFALGWRKPVVDWLVQRGLASVAIQWNLLWVWLPKYILAVLLGLIVRRYFGKQWLVPAVLALFGFLLVPHVVLGIWGETATLRFVARDFVSIPLVFLGAWLGTKIERLTMRFSQPPPASAAGGG